MGYCQTREHEMDNCYVPFTKHDLDEIIMYLLQLSRVLDLNDGDPREVERLKHFADKVEEVMQLAHPRRKYFQLCPLN